MTVHYLGRDLLPPCSPPPGGLRMTPNVADVTCPACSRAVDACGPVPSLDLVIDALVERAEQIPHHRRLYPDLAIGVDLRPVLATALGIEA